MGSDPPGPAASGFSLTVPKQHGAWSILLVSTAVGVLAFPSGSVGAPLLLVACVIAGFMARHAGVTWLRLKDDRRGTVLGWAVVYGLVVGGCGAVLIVGYGLTLLVAIALVAAVFAGVSVALERRRLDRTAWGEVVGTVGLSVVVPAAAYSTTGELGLEALGLWATAALFFCASVPHVRFVVRSKPTAAMPAGERWRRGAWSVAFHGLALGAVAALSVAEVAPRLATLALLPACAKALLPVARPPEKTPNIKRVGFVELGHSVLFAVLVVVVYRVTL